MNEAIAALAPLLPWIVAGTAAVLAYAQLKSGVALLGARCDRLDEQARAAGADHDLLIEIRMDLKALRHAVDQNARHADARG